MVLYSGEKKAAQAAADFEKKHWWKTIDMTPIGRMADIAQKLTQSSLTQFGYKLFSLFVNRQVERLMLSSAKEYIRVLTVFSGNRYCHSYF